MRVAGDDEGREDDCGVLDRLGLAVIHLDESATLVSYNLSAERLLGWADGSRRGRSFGEVLTGSTGLDPDESVVAALAAGRSWAGHLTVHGSGSDVAPLVATVVPVRGVDARPWYVVLLLEPDSGLWPLLTGVLDGWLVLHATGRVTYADGQEALAEELQGALDTRVEIEQAKGFLAGRDGIGTDEAFLRLRGHARDHNLGIREVARQVVAGQLLGPGG